jgi:hypothetical protein
MPRSPRNTSCGPVSASRNTASRAFLTSGGRANALVGLTALHRTADDHLRPSVVAAIAPHAPDLR